MAYAFHGNPMKTLVAMVTSPIDLQWENACHHHNSFSFNCMFLKLTGNVHIDEISDKFENWPGQFINLKSYVSLITEKACLT